MATGLETTGYRVEEIKEGAHQGAVLVIEASPIINAKAITFNEVAGRKKKIAKDACATLTRSLEKVLKRCADDELPFEVEVSGAGERRFNGTYRLLLRPDDKEGDNLVFPKWLKAKKGRCLAQHVHNNCSPFQLSATEGECTHQQFSRCSASPR